MSRERDSGDTDGNFEFKKHLGGKQRAVQVYNRKHIEEPAAAPTPGMCELA